jgi:hypothetical protein
MNEHRSKTYIASTNATFAESGEQCKESKRDNETCEHDADAAVVVMIDRSQSEQWPTNNRCSESNSTRQTMCCVVND